MKVKSKTTYAAAKGLCAGFTLVELLVVIGVIALLLAILMPSLGKARSLASRVKCGHNLKQIYMAVTMYVDGNSDNYPCAQDPVSTSPYYWLWMGRGWRGFLEPYLKTKINKENPSVLLCPQDRTDPSKFEKTSYSYSMAFYHSPAQIDDMNSPSTTYSSPQPSIPQRSSNVGRPSGKILIGEWNSHHLRVYGKDEDGEDKDKGWWCWEGSRNFLFADGRVHFVEARQIQPANDGLPDPHLTKHGIKGVDWSE